MAPDAEGGIITLKPADDTRKVARELNAALIQAGIGVHELSPCPRSLEDIYRDITLMSPTPTEEAA